MTFLTGDDDDAHDDEDKDLTRHSHRHRHNFIHLDQQAVHKDSQ